MLIHIYSKITGEILFMNSGAFNKKYYFASKKAWKEAIINKAIHFTIKKKEW